MRVASVLRKFPFSTDFILPLIPTQPKLLLVRLHQQAGWGRQAGLPSLQGLGVGSPRSLGGTVLCSQGLKRFLTTRNLLSAALFFFLFCQSLCRFVICYRLFFCRTKWIYVIESHLGSFTTTRLKES